MLTKEDYMIGKLNNTVCEYSSEYGICEVICHRGILASNEGKIVTICRDKGVKIPLLPSPRFRYSLQKYFEGNFIP